VIPQSIRWRLPFSYAAIALLTALSLGGVLLAVLGDYYAQREADYLTRNVQTVSDAMTEFMLDDDVPSEALQAQVESFSFLFQTRVRVLDADRRILADSGPFDTFDIRIALGPREFASNIIVIRTAEEEIVPQPRLLPDGGLAITVTAMPPRSPLPPLPPLGIADGDPVFYTVAGTLQGYDLSAGAVLVSNRRSGSRVLQSVHDAEGNLLGYVELSEGPAYGREIVDRVAQGWAVAGIVSVVLAATAGWLISRNLNAPLLDLTNATARMAGGDLSARARVATQRDGWLADLKARNPVARFRKKFARQSDQNEFELLARSFNRMADQVEETVITLRRFVSDAAHEIHTPLTALRTNLELAPDDEFVQRAQAQVGRLEMLTEGLLNLSRVEASEQAEAHAPVALVALVQEVSELYASRAEQAGLTFDLVLPEAPVTVQGDEGQLRCAFGNLLDNAIKFTPGGGEVCVTLCQEGEWAELQVEDSGIGIPKDDLPHLFSRFHRGRNAATYPGSGLGLAIVKAIVVAHEGQVMAENATQGTQFILRLPVGEIDVPETH
jgi:signal transduction histidine kinase